MALVTSKIRSEMSYQFDHFMINHFFETIICAEDTPRPKPHPDPLLLALIDWGKEQGSYFYR